MEMQIPDWLEIGVSQRPKVGEMACGDGQIAIQQKDSLLLAVIDGLGHGVGAAEAANAAIEAIRAHSTLSPKELILCCHEALVKTRGCQIAIMRFDTTTHMEDGLNDPARIGSISFSGIGNVEFFAISTRPIRPISTPGIVGHNIRKVLQFDYEVSAGDLFVSYSDGISHSFRLSDYASLPSAEICQQILCGYGKSYDDCTVAIVRVRPPKTVAGSSVS